MENKYVEQYQASVRTTPAPSGQTCRDGRGELRHDRGSRRRLFPRRCGSTSQQEEPC